MAKKKLSEEDKENYLKNCSKCPYCGSTDITSDPPDADGDTATAEVECMQCEKVWLDVYTLTSIEEK